MAKNFDEMAKQYDQEEYRIERARTVARAIGAVHPSGEFGKVLDFGCGTGLLGFFLADHADEICFADNSEGMLEEVRGKIAARNLKKADTVNLSQDKIESRFDTIVSLMVLHHIDDIQGQVGELTELIRPGGCIFLCDLDLEDGSFHDGGPIPHHGIERARLGAYLEKKGWSILSSSTVYTHKRLRNGVEKDYTVFMIAARMPG